MQTTWTFFVDWLTKIYRNMIRYIAKLIEVAVKLVDVTVKYSAAIANV